jgi:hypothetical protein
MLRKIFINPVYRIEGFKAEIMQFKNASFKAKLPLKFCFEIGNDVPLLELLKKIRLKIYFLISVCGHHYCVTFSTYTLG